MPRRIQISYDDFPVGGDNPQVAIWAAINRSYPELDLTIENSTVHSLVPAEDRYHPNQAQVVIQKGTADNRYVFFYDRFDLSAQLHGIVFTPVEQAKMQAFTRDDDFFVFLSEKTGKPYHTDDVWTDGNFIRYTGGDNHPNFLVKALDRSVFYRGNKTLSFTANQSPD